MTDFWREVEAQAQSMNDGSIWDQLNRELAETELKTKEAAAEGNSDDEDDSDDGEDGGDD